MSSYADYWTQSLNYFGDVISYLAETYEEDDGEAAGKLLSDYRDTILQNHSKIFDDAATELKFYMNFYDVRPSNGVPDELKIFYFLGKAIGEEFEKLGLSNLQMYQLKAVQRIFNKRLAEADVYRVDLSKRIDMAIEKGQINSHFGRFGWYIVHRCLLNSTIQPK